MNEASNFCNGECQPSARIRAVPHGAKLSKAALYEQMRQERAEIIAKRRTQQKTLSSVRGVQFDPNNPPYAIDNWGAHLPLDSHGMSLDAIHFGGALEYNVHNL